MYRAPYITLLYRARARLFSQLNLSHRSLVPSRFRSCIERDHVLFYTRRSTFFPPLSGRIFDCQNRYSVLQSHLTSTENNQGEIGESKTIVRKWEGASRKTNNNFISERTKIISCDRLLFIRIHINNQQSNEPCPQQKVRCKHHNVFVDFLMGNNT